MKSRRLPGRPGRYWVVDAELPSDRDLDRLRSRPFLHVLELPPGTVSLDFLEPVIDTIERLIVTDLHCTDSRILRRARRLTELDLWTDELHPVDFSGLADLRTVAFRWQPELSTVLNCPGLRRVMIEHPPADLAQRLGPKVEELRLDQARLLPPAFSPPPALTSFEISGTRSFDAMSLANSPHIGLLTVTEVTKLAGLVSLSGQVALDSIVLETIGQLDDLDDLHLLRANSLLGIGAPFHDPQVAAALRRAPIKKLRLPPGTYITSNGSTRRRRRRCAPSSLGGRLARTRPARAAAARWENA